MKLLFAVLLLVAGCTVLAPDLKRLYEVGEKNEFQNPVILIPGAFGSRLRDAKTKEEVWPGSLFNILFNDYEQIALPIDRKTMHPAETTLEAYGVFDAAAGRDYYGQIMRTLEQAGGYVRGKPGQPAKKTERRYYVFAYDWRQDNVESAKQLDRLIEQIRVDYGDRKLKADLVGHSMGGLIARYYLRYGTTDVLDSNDFPINNHGASRVRKIILVGTPNLGSVNALQEFLTGSEIGFRNIAPEVLATMPSAYQLFPHPIGTWLVTSEGKELERDLFDAEIWRRFEWSVFDKKIEERVIGRFPDRAEGKAYLHLLQRYFEKHIERGRRFVWSLSLENKQSEAQYVVFGGDCNLTPARILVEDVKGDSLVRLYPNEVTQRVRGVDYEKLMLEPGDGRVTKPSLLARHALDPFVPRHKYSYFPLHYSVLICESHQFLTGNINFQDNLLNILLTRDSP
ncbi:MAG: esterase/lipase family protein [Burkholderiales bacterium]